VTRALATAALLVSAHASAWEAMCRTNDLVDMNGRRLTPAKLEKAVCEDEKVTNCEGMAFARGVQLGEHAMLTYRALTAAGFGPEYTEEAHVFETPDLFEPPNVRQGYFTKGKADIDPTLDSLEPQGPSQMKVFAPRAVALPEVSDLPDWSHSLSEFALGNEHCLPHNVARTTREDVDMCHGFRKGHQGSINANHWPPLHQAAYIRFHGLAQQLANRCRIMESRAPVEPSPVAARMRVLVKACQRESLAMEAYAAHFLEDAFATGHMFMRWGSPMFGPNQVDRLRQSIGAIIVGTIHGARAVTHNHDRANMPGPRDPVSGDGRVEYVTSASSTRYPGGGDMYLRPCLENAPGWNVSEGQNLTAQYQRMLTCVARGFRDVYERGPMGRTPLPAEQGLEQASFDSLSPMCWSQRLTNQSMMKSLAVSYYFDFSREDFARAGSWASTYVDRTVGHVISDRGLKVSTRQWERERVRMRRAMQWLAVTYTRLGTLDPNGTDLANMTGDAEWLRDIFLKDPVTGAPNLPWSGVYLPLVADGGVPFYEGPTLTSWGTPSMTAMCMKDDDCANGQYCDTSALELGTGTPQPRCVRHETAIMRAFRPAETIPLCKLETWDDLQAARAACQRTGSSSSPECLACVQVISPRLRNACDPGSTYRPRSQGVDNESICDHYQAYSPNGVVGFVHVPYKPDGGETWEQAYDRVVRKACLDGASDAGGGAPPLGVAYNFNAFDGTFPSIPERTYFKATCGKTADAGAHWVSFTFDNSTTAPMTLGMALRPADRQFGAAQPASPYTYLGQGDDLVLESFQPPGCSAAGPSTRAVLSGDTQRLSFVLAPMTSQQFCLRVSPRDETVRTGYTLSIGHPPLY
jgi:hypothetical protein